MTETNPRHDIACAANSLRRRLLGPPRKIDCDRTPGFMARTHYSMQFAAPAGVDGTDPTSGEWLPIL